MDTNTLSTQQEAEFGSYVTGTLANGRSGFEWLALITVICIETEVTELLTQSRKTFHE
jgi:hypothetical protein